MGDQRDLDEQGESVLRGPSREGAGLSTPSAECNNASNAVTLCAVMRRKTANVVSNARKRRVVLGDRRRALCREACCKLLKWHCAAPSRMCKALQCACATSEGASIAGASVAIATTGR